MAAASLAARKAALRLKRHDDWTEPGNLWALIVGRPGVMKTPAMSAALAPLERLEAAAADAFNDAAALHKAAALAAKIKADVAAQKAKDLLKKDHGADVSGLLLAGEEPAAPVRSRYIVNGPTWEKLHALLAENGDGLLMVRDEMRGWFLDMGREEKAEARAFFVASWSGGRFTVDRIERGTITAEDMRLSIIGAIQPGPLSHILRGSRGQASDDGLDQ